MWKLRHRQLGQVTEAGFPLRANQFCQRAVGAEGILCFFDALLLLSMMVQTPAGQWPKEKPAALRRLLSVFVLQLESQGRAGPDT